MLHLQPWGYTTIGANSYYALDEYGCASQECHSRLNFVRESFFIANACSKEQFLFTSLMTNDMFGVSREHQCLIILSLADKRMWPTVALVLWGILVMLRCRRACSTERGVGCGVNSETILKICFQYDVIDLQYHKIWMRKPVESHLLQHLLEFLVDIFDNLYGVKWHLCRFFFVKFPIICA